MEIRTETKSELVVGQYEVINLVKDYLVSKWIIDPKDAQGYIGEFVRDPDNSLLINLVFTKETKTLDFMKI